MLIENSENSFNFFGKKNDFSEENRLVAEK